MSKQKSVQPNLFDIVEIAVSKQVVHHKKKNTHNKLDFKGIGLESAYKNFGDWLEKKRGNKSS